MLFVSLSCSSDAFLNSDPAPKNPLRWQLQHFLPVWDAEKLKFRECDRFLTDPPALVGYVCISPVLNFYVIPGFGVLPPSLSWAISHEDRYAGTQSFACGFGRSVDP